MHSILPLLLGLAAAASPWPPSARQRAEAIVAKMADVDLYNLTAAMQMSPYQGTIPAQPHNGLPHQGHHDGPQGVAGGFTRVTAFPSENSIANTFDLDLARKFGAANGMEHRIKGSNVQLSPSVNIARIPWCECAPRPAGRSPSPNPNAASLSPLPHHFSPLQAVACLNTSARTARWPPP